MGREPVQARSVESMHRMLDAGETLFLEGGSADLKLELILELSRSHPGSFYARFGDMHGYLEALHERAITRMESGLSEAMAKARLEETLSDALTTYYVDTLRLLRIFRATLYFFAVGNSHDATFRQAGARAVLAHRTALLEVLKPFVVNPSKAASRRRLDMVARLSHAMIFQLIMFDQDEVSPSSLSDQVLAKELARTLADALAPFTPDD